MIPTWLQAIIIGIVQGLTEFVPVSSSGHLVLVPYVLGWERPGLPFDVALHAGTALAVIVYFRTELTGMLLAVVRRGDSPTRRFYRRLLALLVIATLPVGVAGLTLRGTFETVFQTPPVAAAFLLVTAAVLVAGEKLRQRRLPRPAEPARTSTDGGHHEETRAAPGPSADARQERDRAAAETPAHPAIAANTGTDPSDPAGRTLERLSVPLAVGVGVAQAFALLPGISRSGTTIMAGVAGGMTRAAATRFAFLLSLPALLGASLVSLPGLREPGPYGGLDVAAGVAAAAVSSYLAIAFLIRLVSRASLTVFVRYLLVAGVLGLLAYAMLGPPSTV